MADKYNAPSGPPPQYPQQAHADAGPYYPPNPVGSPGPGSMNQMGPYSQAQHSDGYYGPQGGYPQQGGYQQGPWPPQQQNYGPPQPGMYYQQGPPGGHYEDRGRGGGAAGGICAGLLGALACCCCLDAIF